MKYQIDNIEIKQVNGNGNKYVELSLSDPDDMFNEPCVVAVFTPAVVTGYERMLTSVQGDLTKLPEKAKWFPHAIWVTIPLPQPMYRRWGRPYDTVDKNGVITHHEADDLICDKSGKPKLYTEFRVLCKETIDQERIEAGYSVKEATQWAHGWDPTSRGNSYISSFFVSAEKGDSTSVQQPAVNTPQPTQAPVQQPTQQQQFVQQPVQAPVV